MTSDTSIDVQLDQLVHAQPHMVISEGKRLLAQSPGDHRLAMEVWAAVGRALYELGDMHRAPDAMRLALRFGENASSDLLDGEATDIADRLMGVRVSAAAVFAESGDLREALDQLDHAETAAPRTVVGRIQSQRAFILTQAGQLIDASQAADLAAETFRRSRDQLGRLRLWVIRSLIELQRGELDQAEAFLLQAQRLSRRLGQDVIAAGVVANLGVVHARAGRIVVAMRHFDDAQRRYIAAGSPWRMMAVLEADRADALVRSGLFDEAVVAAHGAVTRAARSGSLVNKGDASLLLARTQLAAGRYELARRTALGAARLLAASHRSGVALQARAIGLQAALARATSETSAVNLFARSRAIGVRLERHGWVEMSDDLRCARMRCALRFDRVGLVDDDLVHLQTGAPSITQSIAVRAAYARALAQRGAGDSVGALRSARRGMQALERHRRSTDDLQMRAGLSVIGDDLASLGLGMAFESASAREVFRWAERTHAHAFQSSAEPTVASVQGQLGRRVLVEFVTHDGFISAVVVSRSTARLVGLGTVATARRLIDRLTAQMGMVTRSATDEPLRRARETAQQLGQQLIEPLGLRTGRDVVIVPGGLLHSVPWSALPQLAESATTVHISAAMWLSSVVNHETTPLWSVGLITGPGVDVNRFERDALRSRFPSAAVVSGARATAKSLTTMLGRFDVVQIAAHGAFRPDQPLASTLRLHDGDMPIYELDRVDLAARLVMLSSCEAGVHGVNAGGEPLGLVAILLGRGASTVIAPMYVVPDRACAEFVSDFHREWATGVTAADALAAVRRSWLARSTFDEWLTAAAFTCFGTGLSVVRA